MRKKPALGALEGYAMALAVTKDGLSKTYMPGTFDLLVTMGLIDLAGRATTEGHARYDTYRDERWTDALKRNVVPELRDDVREALLTLHAGEQPTGRALYSSPGLVMRGFTDGIWRLTPAGVRVCEIMLTQE